MTIVYRTPESHEHSALLELDDSFVTDLVFTVEAGPEAFVLRPRRVDPPLAKVFPDDGGVGSETSSSGFLLGAFEGGRPCGFVRAAVQDWNRRLVIEQITVAPESRGRGVGRELMGRACAFGLERGARTAWLETSNVNVPAVRAYQRMGFTLCGLDTTLYRGTKSEGEIALFMARPLGDGGRPAG